jgi:hypothetical protein
MVERTDPLFEKLRSLFQETVNHHHQAYLESEGEDPEWPLWYADYLLADLGKLLNATFTKSELIYLLILVEKQRGLQAPGSDWATYYARFFSERYS